jgi:hypothetical protein
MDKDASGVWRRCFESWPSELERRGVLVTTFGEQILFDSFAISPDLLLVERRAPDTVGARTVIVSYEQIAALKIVEVTKQKAFQSMGFVPAPSRKP